MNIVFKIKRFYLHISTYIGFTYRWYIDKNIPGYEVKNTFPHLLLPEVAF